jgi:uncharacterized protein (DUF305 family)
MADDPPGSEKMARVLTALLTAGILTLGAPCALAQHDHGAPEASHDSHVMTSAGGEMMRAMQQMQGAMGAPMSGDFDVDFARMMIPHHQGAIDMARLQLAHGKDPELRKLAEEIIGAQENEIRFLNDWLARKGG